MRLNMLISMKKGPIVLSILFVFLVIAGSAGAIFEPMHNGEERCLVCENTSRPPSKTSSVRGCIEYQKLFIAQPAIRKDLSNSLANYDNSCLNHPQGTHFRILLI